MKNKNKVIFKISVDSNLHLQVIILIKVLIFERTLISI